MSGREYTEEEIRDKLLDYVKVDNIMWVPQGRHIRYFERIESSNEEDEEWKFVPGGTLSYKDPEARFVYLSTGEVRWPVPVSENTKFFKVKESIIHNLEVRHVPKTVTDPELPDIELRLAATRNRSRSRSRSKERSRSKKEEYPEPPQFRITTERYTRDDSYYSDSETDSFKRNQKIEDKNKLQRTDRSRRHRRSRSRSKIKEKRSSKRERSSKSSRKKQQSSTKKERKKK